MEQRVLEPGQFSCPNCTLHDAISSLLNKLFWNKEDKT